MKLLLKIITPLLLLLSLSACSQNVKPATKPTTEVPDCSLLSKLATEIVMGRVSDIQKDDLGKTTAAIQVTKTFKGHAQSGDTLIFGDIPLAPQNDFASPLVEDQDYLFLLKETKGKAYFQLVNPYLGKIALAQKDLALGAEAPANFEQVREDLLHKFH